MLIACRKASLKMGNLKITKNANRLKLKVKLGDMEEKTYFCACVKQ